MSTFSSNPSLLSIPEMLHALCHLQWGLCTLSILPYQEGLPGTVPVLALKILYLGDSLRHRQTLFMWDCSFFLNSFSYSLSYLNSSVIKAGKFFLTPLPFPIFLTQTGLTPPLYALRTLLLHSTIFIVILIINLFL